MNEIPVKVYNVPFKSHPFHFSNIKAYFLVKKILKQNKYDAIVCSTPIGGTIGRLAGRKVKVPKIIYCAHGFLFRKGINPLLYWIFRSHEKFLAKYTDTIVTITDEDYKAAKNFKLRNNGGVFFVHGAGVDFTKKDLSVDSLQSEINKILNRLRSFVLRFKIYYRHRPSCCICKSYRCRK